MLSRQKEKKSNYLILAPYYNLAFDLQYPVLERKTQPINEILVCVVIMLKFEKCPRLIVNASLSLEMQS